MFNWLNDLIKRLFGISDIEYLDAPHEEVNQEVINKIQEETKRTESTEEAEIKIIDQEQEGVPSHEETILNLQSKFRDGKITEEDLTEKETEELVALYKKQIEEVKVSMQQYQTLIDHFKQIVA